MIASFDIYKLYESARDMAAELKSQAEAQPTKANWDAWTALSGALPGLFGAFGALGLEEMKNPETQAEFVKYFTSDSEISPEISATPTDPRRNE